MRLAAYMLSALILGVAGIAYAQDAAPSALTDPNAAVLVDLLRAVGLPGVLVWLAFNLGRGGGIPVAVSLSEADREAIRCECGKHGSQ